MNATIFMYLRASAITGASFENTLMSWSGKKNIAAKATSATPVPNISATP